MSAVDFRVADARVRFLYTFATAFSFAFLIPSQLASQDLTWLKGTIVDIAQGTTEAGTTATSTASTNGSTTTRTTVSRIPYSDYTIRAGNKLFVVRPDPVAPRASLASKIGSRLGWDWLKANGVPGTIPVNVGDSVSIVPEGNHASVRDRHGKEYPCSLVRQTLVSEPENGSVKDQSDEKDIRPTLRHDQ